MTTAEVGIVGAGPYGLSVAAHLRARGVSFRIFGQPMQTWRPMPRSLSLKSLGFATSIAVPERGHDFPTWLAARGLETLEPISYADFTEYGLDLQRRFVPECEPVHVSRVESPPGGGYDLTLETGERLKVRSVVVASRGAFQRCGELAVSRASWPPRWQLRLLRVWGQAGRGDGASQSALEATVLLHGRGPGSSRGARPSSMVHSGKRPLLDQLREPLTSWGGRKPGAGQHHGPCLRARWRSPRTSGFRSLVAEGPLVDQVSVWPLLVSASERNGRSCSGSPSVASPSAGEGVRPRRLWLRGSSTTSGASPSSSRCGTAGPHPGRSSPAPGTSILAGLALRRAVLGLFVRPAVPLRGAAHGSRRGQTSGEAAASRTGSPVADVEDSSSVAPPGCCPAGLAGDDSCWRGLGPAGWSGSTRAGSGSGPHVRDGMDRPGMIHRVRRSIHRTFPVFRVPPLPPAVLLPVGGSGHPAERQGGAKRNVGQAAHRNAPPSPPAPASRRVLHRRSMVRTAAESSRCRNASAVVAGLKSSAGVDRPRR